MQRAAAASVFDCRACVNECLVSSTQSVGNSGQTVEWWNRFIRSEDFASLGLKVIQVLVGKHPVGCHGPFSEEWILSDPSTSLIDKMLYRWLSFSKLSYPLRGSMVFDNK